MAIQHTHNTDHQRRTVLNVASGLLLPVDAVTQTFAVYGVRRAGKTNTATVLVEEMLKMGLQVVVLDPVGAWWGLRSGRNGKTPGLPIVVLGGYHGDVPLEPTAGAVIAEFVADTETSCVLDLSAWSKGDRTRFAGPFAEALYRALGKRPKPVHLVLEEAKNFIPQRPFPGEMAMLGAMEDATLQGGGRGLGVTIVAQRPSTVNKNITTQMQTLIVHRIVGPQDIDAIDDWVKERAARRSPQRDELMNEITQLPRGTAYVWSPEWLKAFRRVEVRARETFDSSATPTVGMRRQDPKVRAEVDLEALRRRIGATIEQARLNDPAALRQRIAALERDLAVARADTPAQVERIEVPVVTEDHATLLRETAERFERAAASLADGSRAMQDYGHQIVAELRLMAAKIGAGRPPVAITTPISAGAARPSATVPSPALDCPSAYEQAVIDALARITATGVSSAASVRHLAALAGKSPRSSAYKAALSSLRKAGVIEHAGDGLVRLTDAGRAVAPPHVAPVSTSELIAAYEDHVLTAYQRAVFRAAVDRYPGSISRDDLAGAAGKSAGSSLFKDTLSTLRTLGIVEFPGTGLVRASDVLFRI